MIGKTVLGRAVLGRAVLGTALLGTAHLALAQTAAPAPAPEASPAEPAAEDADADEIVVTGSRTLPGQVIGDIPPEVQLSPADIRSYGVSTVTDLLNELAPQTGSGQGRGGEAPVVLLNGKRISGLREIRDIPTEAIQRVDILPEEVALKYGYGADQKVVNIVLRRRFRSITSELVGGLATDGGGGNGSGDLNLLRIRGDGRLNLDVKYQASAALSEADRGIDPSRPRRPYDLLGNVTAVPGAGSAEIDPALSALAGLPVTVAGVPAGGAPSLAGFAASANRANLTDDTRYRSLRPASDQLSINAVLNRTLFDNVSATLNAGFDATGSSSRRGLAGGTLIVPAGDPFSPFADDVALYRYAAGVAPLRQDVAGESGHLGLTLNGSVAKWQWSLTGNADHSDSRTRTGTGLDLSRIQDALDARDPALDPFGPLPFGLVGALAPDRARAKADSGDLALTANGSLLDLPAGALSTTVKLGATASRFDTRSTRAGVARAADLSRREVNGQVNLDLPLTSRRRDVLAAVGDLSANFNATADRVSDFGTLSTIGYGLTWRPRDRISLIWSHSDEEGAPTIQQLGNPQIVTPDVRVFDFVRGETVDVTRIDGGNSALRADDRHVAKLGLTLKPLAKADLTLVANYVRSRTEDAIASLPAATAAIEAAFPDRYLRNPDRSLAQIDNRPINYLREIREQLRWGFNFSKPIKSNTQRLFEAWRAARGNGGGGRWPGSDRGDRPDRAPAAAPSAAGTGGSARAGEAPAGAPTAAPSPADAGASATGGAAGGYGYGGGGGNWGGLAGGGIGGAGGGRGGGAGGFGGRGGGGGGAQGGRLQFAVYHTWVFRDDILVREGVPVLDLLDGAANGGNGGVSRHRIEAQAGIARNGWGARLSGNWQSGTTIRGGLGGGGTGGGAGVVPGDLGFSALATANLRLFANLGQIPSLAKRPWARGLRVTLSANNLLNTRQRVRDESGATPLGYQPGLLDPVGRSLSISVRKLFF